MLLTETSHFSLRPGDGTGAFGEVKATPWTFQSAPGVPGAASSCCPNGCGKRGWPWEELQPPKNIGRLKRIPVLESLGPNSTAQSSNSPLTQTEQKYYTQTTCWAAAVILFLIQVVINTLINHRGV